MEPEPVKGSSTRPVGAENVRISGVREDGDRLLRRVQLVAGVLPGDHVAYGVGRWPGRGPGKLLAL